MESFYRNSGFCYKCYWESPQASQSIFKPELCTAHLGIEERDLGKAVEAVEAAVEAARVAAEKEAIRVATVKAKELEDAVNEAKRVAAEEAARAVLVAAEQQRARRH